MHSVVAHEQKLLMWFNFFFLFYSKRFYWFCWQSRASTVQTCTTAHLSVKQRCSLSINTKIFSPCLTQKLSVSVNGFVHVMSWDHFSTPIAFLVQQCHCAGTSSVIWLHSGFTQVTWPALTCGPLSFANVFDWPTMQQVHHGLRFTVVSSWMWKRA